jgi:hypothetical protein
MGRENFTFTLNLRIRIQTVAVMQDMYGALPKTHCGIKNINSVSQVAVNTQRHILQHVN